MNIIEIYNKYHLPENLQMHMLRVASCCNLILDNWKGHDIDKEQYNDLFENVIVAVLKI